jgi:hypothetical protein
MHEESHRSCLRKSELFFSRQLDYPNQLDLVHEIRFCAHAIGVTWNAVIGWLSPTFCLSGKSLPCGCCCHSMTGLGVVERDRLADRGLSKVQQYVRRIRRNPPSRIHHATFRTIAADYASLNPPYALDFKLRSRSLTMTWSARFVGVAMPSSAPFRTT